MRQLPTRKRITKQKGWRIDSDIADEFTEFCSSRGWNPNRQIEIAIKNYLDAHSPKPVLGELEPGSPEEDAYWLKTAWRKKRNPTAGEIASGDIQEGQTGSMRRDHRPSARQSPPSQAKQRDRNVA